MKNKFKLFGLAVLVTAIVFSFAALSLAGCDTGGDPTDPALNGTWVDEDDNTLVFDNGAFVLSGNYNVKGTFTTSGGSITLKPTHAKGNDEKWYTKAEAIAVGATEDDQRLLFSPVTNTYSISGNTLTLNAGNKSATYTKQ